MTTSLVSAEKTAFLPVSADDAFALLTQPERLRRWQTVSARVDLRAGGEYHWTVVPGHVAAGTFTEVEPGKRIVFGWGWEGADGFGPDASTVTVTFEPADGGTLVRLVHAGLTEEQAASHMEGWNHFFERLEKAAADGDAGPDEWAYAPADLNLHTAADATLAVLQQVLRGIVEADKPKPTPCKDFTVHELAEHLIDGIERLTTAAGGTPDVVRQGPLESVVATAAQQANEAWVKRGTEGTVVIGPGEIPATMAATILSIEYLIHAWDFAQATGQQVHVSDEVVDYVLSIAAPIIAGGRERGAFGAEVESGPDARALERLAAFSGRRAA
jgi:uncharacterized protein (TIGR03086 family)